MNQSLVLPKKQKNSRLLRRVFGPAVQREAFGLVALILLAIVIIGPISTVFLWAFAEKWRYPSLLPTQWGLSYWVETLSRSDIAAALPLHLVVESDYAHWLAGQDDAVRTQILAQRFEGRRYDCGRKLGYLEATVDFGLKHPETGEGFARFLAERGR